MANHKGAVICLGEVLIDQVVDQSGQRQDYPGGAPANVAVALARLGLSAAFIGAVGRDRQGQLLAQTLAAQGVDCQGLQRCDAPTRVVEVRCTPKGDRTFGGFIGGDTTAFADTQLAAAGLVRSQLQSAEALITGTLGLAYPATRAAMGQAAATVQGQGGLLIVDVNWRPTFWPDSDQAIARLRPWLQQADLIKVAVDEAITLFQTADLETLATIFPQANLLLTDGDRGCQYRFADHIGQVPAFTVTAVETTGAGDAFLAGIVEQWRRQNWQFETTEQITSAGQFASAMGALTTQRPGAIAALPTVAELLDFLHTHTGQVWTVGGV